MERIDLNLSKTIVQLFDDDFTIPFLCRYRKDLINNLTPDRLREIKETIDDVKLMEVKSQSILKLLDKEKLLNDDISWNIKSARSLEELEHLAQLYKPPSKGSLYERAQKIGLEPPAMDLLYGKQQVNLSKFVKSIDGLRKLEEVDDGVKNIMSCLIAKNESIMNEVRQLQLKFGITITTSEVKQKKTAKDDKANVNAQKFENYFDFSCSADRIKSHQILAINRGESLKVRFLHLITAFLSVFFSPYRS